MKAIVNHTQGHSLVHSESRGIHTNSNDAPFHTASIGKAFTAVIIAMLTEEGKLRYEDPVTQYLPQHILAGLHTYKGRDYANEIYIHHLMRNTSGLPDYFECKTIHGRFADVLLKNPQKVWTPEEVIQWSKDYLKPKFAPGKGIHYSNTGFNLLGMIIENITGKPYSDILHQYIFDRVGMEHSYLSHFSRPKAEPPAPITPISFGDTVIHPEQQKSFTSIYAAGQTVSTTEDLLRFMKALNKGNLIRRESLEAMMQWKAMRVGIDYGYGLMRVRMMAFMPKYNVWGHLGSTGTYMLYSSAFDTYLIGGLHKTGTTGASIRHVFSALRAVSRTIT